MSAVSARSQRTRPDLVRAAPVSCLTGAEPQPTLVAAQAQTDLAGEGGACLRLFKLRSGARPPSHLRSRGPAVKLAVAVRFCRLRGAMVEPERVVHLLSESSQTEATAREARGSGSGFKPCCRHLCQPSPHSSAPSARPRQDPTPRLISGAPLPTYRRPLSFARRRRRPPRPRRRCNY